MAKHSFQAKAWVVAAASASSGFLMTKFPIVSFPAFILPIALLMIFGTLDAYYLYLERGYRCLYDSVVDVDNKSNIRDFVMNIPASGRGYKKFFKLLFSKTIGGFYVTLIAVTIVYFLFFTKR